LAADAVAVRTPAVARRFPITEAVGGGFIVGYLSLVVLLPLAALVAEAGNFSSAVTNCDFCLSSGLLFAKAATPATWTNGNAHSYKFVVTVQDTDSAQSQTATAGFTWEARNQ